MAGLKQRRSGFSLVELLVVLGIIAILIGLLMPALANARENALRVQCSATLRTIFHAAEIHELDHHGFMPVGGWHWDPVGGIVNPRGLQDNSATRYIYYQDAGIQRPVPITVALGISLGVKVRLDSRANLELDMQSPQLRKYFKCPSQEEVLSGITQKSSEPWQPPGEWSSYIFNEAMLGLRGNGTTNESLMARATRIKHPASVLFAMDGRPRNQENDNWLMVFDKGREDTLWDFQVMVSPTDTGFGKQLIDFLRHRYRMNVAFVDGHVETVPMTREGLESVGISKGIHD